MAEKFNPDNKLTHKELAQQLRKPVGNIGKEVGLQMNRGNKFICINSYKVLNPKACDRILEIGMGNGFFIKDLLAMADNLDYTGVDFSKTMVEEASALNKKLIGTGKVRFCEASIEKLPFNDNSFDCITTTNTLYFWPKPENDVKELSRVLKPGGKLLIGYRSKRFMDKIVLSKYGFEKYEIQDVESLLKNASFKQVSTQVIDEPDLDFDGKTFKIQGVYSVCHKSCHS
tara:strand:+ start:62218 stop:62904 length:687 start_codon:yes stop_codon:yes gene_type:complete